MSAIFLSASVPIEGRAGYRGSDPFLIREAISSFIEVVLGRRLIVWGGQPAITPMIWAAAEALSLDYRDCVKLFQSRYFEDRFPLDNERFGNVTYVPAEPAGQAASLRRMREEMLTSEEFEAAIFVGGMEGILDEYELCRAIIPKARIIALPSAGGMARRIFDQEKLPAELEDAFDYTSWLYQLTGIRPSERRRARLRD